AVRAARAYQARDFDQVSRLREETKGAEATTGGVRPFDLEFLERLASESQAAQKSVDQLQAVWRSGDWAAACAAVDRLSMDGGIARTVWQAELDEKAEAAFKLRQAHLSIDDGDFEGALRLLDLVRPESAPPNVGLARRALEIGVQGKRATALKDLGALQAE